MTMGLMVFLMATSALSIGATASQDPQREFRERAARLKAQGEATDRLIYQMKLNSGFGDASPTPKGDAASEEKKRPLFMVHGQLSVQRIPVGKVLFGKLANRLVVGTDGSPVFVDIDQDQGALAGLRVLGVARQSATPGRLSIEFSRLLLRSGNVVSLQAIALDTQGAFGLDAQVFSSKALVVAGAMASSFISGLAAAQQSQVTNSFGFSQTQTTGRNALLQGVAQTAADQSKHLIEESTSEKPVLVIEPSAPISVLVQEEVLF